MRCPECQFENREGAKFCKKCGAKLELACPKDHAQRACYAALSIQKAIGDYGAKVKKDCGIEFTMRIGINSGPVIVGSIGDDLRMDYTAVGDTTNLASRMESEARPGSILVSKHTHKIAGDYFEFEPIGKVLVKGKAEPQEAYELIKTGIIETRIKAAVAKGLTKFVGRKNSMAALKEPFESVLTGSGRVAGIVGEAGVGKSRLLYEFFNQLSVDDVTCLEGRCLQYGGAIIYMPILGILKTYFDIKEDDREFIINKKIRGEDSKKAIQYLKLSGNKAIRNHSVYEAYHFYTEARYP